MNAEAWSYYLIKASADLAVEQGVTFVVLCETKYGDGITPNQTYKTDVDELVPHVQRAHGLERTTRTTKRYRYSQ